VAEVSKKWFRRQIVFPAEEWAVRYAAYRAMEQVVALSGKSEGVVDWFFYNARKRCPEMTEWVRAKHPSTNAAPGAI
jgi:hypothetical protein